MNKTNAWVLYDWANSAFALVVVSAFFPILFKEYWSCDVADSITLGRIGIASSLVGIIVAFTAPLFAALASTSGRPKSYLISWTLIGVVCTALLSFAPACNWLLPLILFACARIAFQLSLLFYDAILPKITDKTNRHRVSARGFAYGYLGGALLFVLNFILLLWVKESGGIVNMLAPGLQIPTVQTVEKFAILSAGIWWVIFAIPLFQTQFGNAKASVETKQKRISQAVGDLKKGFIEIGADKRVLYFLVAYWLYIDGVHSVILMSSNFGLSVGVTPMGLIVSLLVVQLVAFPASIIAGGLAQKKGAVKIITSMVLGYAAIVLIGALCIKNSTTFLILAIGVGLFQGGVQSLSRSRFTEIIPVEKSTLYFGIYNMVGRFSVVLGPLFITLITILGKFLHFSEGTSIRLGFGSLALFFIGGTILLKKSSAYDKA